MYELDKAAFGRFLAQLRREKGMTQKELAATLYVSDKAVSKWERGLSVPDISLLVPLAEQLNVTVAELLQGRRVEEERRFTREETEDLIRKAVTFSAGGDLFGRAAGAPSGADEEVSAGVCHLLCAGRRRSAGRLGGGTGRHRGSAGSAHRRCGFRRRLRGLCHVLDGRDPFGRHGRDQQRHARTDVGRGHAGRAQA